MDWMAAVIITFIFTVMWVSYRETVEENKKREADRKAGKKVEWDKPKDDEFDYR